MKNKIKKLFNKIIELRKFDKFCYINSIFMNVENKFVIGNFTERNLLHDLNFFNKRDFYDLYFDFEKETISLYAYDENCHNGDHYNCLDVIFEFDKICLFENFLNNYLKHLVSKEQESLIMLEKQKIKDQLINDRFIQLLQD